MYVLKPVRDGASSLRVENCLIQVSCFWQLPSNPRWVVDRSREGKERNGGAECGCPGLRGKGARVAAILPWWRRVGCGRRDADGELRLRIRMSPRSRDWCQGEREGEREGRDRS